MIIEFIVNCFVEICCAGNWMDVYCELFVVDVKVYEMEGLFDCIIEGVDVFIVKGEVYVVNWDIVYEVVVMDLFIFNNFFSVGMCIDVICKDGICEVVEEMCVYEVKDGKIIVECFFYSMG